MTAEVPRKGDRYVFRQGGKDEAFIEVTRASVAGWVDIRCWTWAVSWTKRMPIGLPPDWIRRDWTQSDLDAQQARWEQEHAS